jgi:hypothetical protein
MFEAEFHPDCKHQDHHSKFSHQINIMRRLDEVQQEGAGYNTGNKIANQSGNSDLGKKKIYEGRK